MYADLVRFEVLARCWLVVVLVLFCLFNVDGFDTLYLNYCFLLSDHQDAHIDLVPFPRRMDACFVIPAMSRQDSLC